MSMVKYRASLALLLTLVVVGVTAQTLPIKRVGVMDGLSNNDVMSIVQDKYGYMWFATEEGLNRFDGSECINFYSDAPTSSISANELNKLYYDESRNQIWISTQRSDLNMLDCQSGKFTNYNDIVEGLPQFITTIKDGQNGKIWLGSYYNGAMLLDPDTHEIHNYSKSNLPGLVSNTVVTLAYDKKGSLYLGHMNEGLSIISLNSHKTKNLNTENSNLAGGRVNSIYIDTNDQVWVGTNCGLMIYDQIAQDFIPIILDGDNSIHVRDIFQSSDGAIWVTTDLNGAYVLRYHSGHGFVIEHHYEYHNDGSGLSALGLRDVHEDQYGNIWLATYGGGVNFIQKRAPLFMRLEYSSNIENIESLTNRFAWGLCVDQHNRLWVGTDGDGINLFDNNKRIKTYNTSNSQLTSNNIISMHCDKEGKVWIGTYDKGLFISDGNAQNPTIRPFPISGLREVRDIHEDDHGRLWVVGSSAMMTIDVENTKLLERYDTNIFEDKVLRSIEVDSKGQIWVGLYGKGIYVLDKDMKNPRRFSIAKGFISNMINDIYEDSRGNICVATGNGMAYFDNLDEGWDYKVINKSMGLTNNHIRAIGEDTSNNIWISTNEGISLLQVDDELEVTNFYSTDNLPQTNFKSNSITKDRDGLIYFGSQDGVAFFSPEWVLSSNIYVEMTLTDFETHNSSLNCDHTHFNTSFGANEPLKLSCDERSFTIKFNPLDFSLHNSLEYRYRLNGHSNMWYETTDTKATFFNVSSGKYVFELQSSLANGEWSEETYKLPISIAYPLFASPFFIILYIVISILIVIFLIIGFKVHFKNQSELMLERSNNKFEKKLNKERLQFYTNITHELRTPLTLIVGPMEDLRRDTTLTEEQLRKIDYISKSAERLLKLINQILDFRKTETKNRSLLITRGSISNLINDIVSKYQNLGNKNNITINSDITPNILCYYDAEVLTIILDNLISNAIKYTNKGEVMVALHESSNDGVDYVSLSVADTGIGISAESKDQIFDRYYRAENRNAEGTGIGLSLVKDLVDLHEGYIKVESHVGIGSIFTFSLVKDNTYPMEKHTQSIEAEGHLVDENDTKPLVLLVEDDYAIRKYIVEAFENRYKVIEAGDGKMGVEMAIEHIPDVIISDIMMPALSGIELCKRLKGDIQTSHIPIVLLTAKDSLSDKEAGYQAGADSYITKPFSATLVISRISNIIENRKSIASRLMQHAEVIESKADSDLTAVDFVEREFINKLTTLIEDNMTSNKLDISFLASELCMSNSSLYRKVKALTGITTNDYIRKIKLSRAKKLLSENRYTIVDVAFMVGFSNAIYFRQCFKDEFNITPSKFVKSQSEEKQNIIQSTLE